MKQNFSNKNNSPMRVLKLDNYKLYYGYYPPSGKYLYHLVTYRKDSDRKYWYANMESKEEIKAEELQNKVINPLKSYIDRLVG